MPYILNGDKETREMLKAVGVTAPERLFDVLPAAVRLNEPLKAGAGASELKVKKEMTALARKNKPLERYNAFLGAGCYDHYVPAAVDFILSHSSFLTAYTPYQAECSQGILQAIYEYQSYICLLTGMDVANASVFDGASALAESALAAMRFTRRSKVVVAGAVHPEYLAVINTYLSGIKVTPVRVDFSNQGVIDFNALKDAVDADTACVIFQSPNFFGLVEDADSLATLVKHAGALLVMAANPFAMALLKPPAQAGVDIVCGEGQSLGGGLNFGGPGFGFMAAKNDYLRQMPGRIVGKTKDHHGREAYCLTMQAREQHIRREKATSNICSNQSFNAIAAAVYLAVTGREGFRAAADKSFSGAHYLYDRLKVMRGVKLVFGPRFFNEFVWEVENAVKVLARLKERGIVAGYHLGKEFALYKNCVLSCCTEKKSKEEIDNFVNTLALILHG